MVDDNIFDSRPRAAVKKRENDICSRVSVAKHLINDIIAGANDYFYEYAKDAGINTLYKKKADKIKPVDLPHPGGIKPEGALNWRTKAISQEIYQPGKYAGWIIPKFSSIKKGSRLTPERLEKLKLGEGLSDEEKDVFYEMLYNREAAIAFNFEEKGYFNSEIEPPHVIPTIDHVPWQVKNFQVPKALEGEVINIIKDRMQCGALERSFGPYRNPWFLVPKKTPGKYRLINSAQRLNAVTIRDASLPPTVDEFSEAFAGFPLISLLDFFSGYDQCVLAEESRDLTAFMTPFGLLRMTTLPQGYTNGVQVFDRFIRKALSEQIAQGRSLPFVDDVGIRPNTRSFYKREGGEEYEEVMPGVKKYVMEAISSLDQTLADIERSGGTVSGEKSEFLKDGVKVVAFVCGSAGRTPEAAKVHKIINWRPCESITEVKGFLGLCVYYRVWIKDFAMRADPLYELTHRKKQMFYWGQDQQAAMEDLKSALTHAPALRPLDYQADGKIILSVDSSLLGWGAILQQEEGSDSKKRHPSRYENGLWSPAEKKYDSGKLECRGLLRGLKKLRFYLYGIRFLVEIDAKTLVHQLNQPASDLPRSVVNRWLAWIRRFDFDLKHVAGTKHGGPDALSRREKTSDSEDEGEGDIEDEMDAALSLLFNSNLRPEIWKR